MNHKVNAHLPTGGDARWPARQLMWCQWLIIEAVEDIFATPFFKRKGLDQYSREAHDKKSKYEMKKKPDLVLLLFIVFGLGVAMSALGQVLF